MLALKTTHALTADDIAGVTIGTFAAARRLDAWCLATTEQAQYSLPFPVAAALVHGRVGVAEIESEVLHDPRGRALSESIEVAEVAAYEALFPAERWSDVTIHRNDGRVLESGRTTAPGDPESPLDDAAPEDEFRALATPVLGNARTERLLDCVRGSGNAASLERFVERTCGGVEQCQIGCFASLLEKTRKPGASSLVQRCGTRGADAESHASRAKRPSDSHTTKDSRSSVCRSRCTVLVASALARANSLSEARVRAPLNRVSNCSARRTERTCPAPASTLACVLRRPHEVVVSRFVCSSDISFIVPTTV